jgi:hypothetical protein
VAIIVKRDAIRLLDHCEILQRCKALQGLLDAEGGGTTILRNFGYCLPVTTAYSS